MTNQDDTTDQTVLSPWRGFHHIGLLTHDLEATIHFYQELLGMEAAKIRPSPRGRHVFIKPGLTTAWGFHFFESPDATPPDPATLKTIPFAPTLHFAFAIADEAAAIQLRERLVAQGVTVTDINEIGPIRNILFHDNNGLLLEATWATPPQ